MGAVYVAEQQSTGALRALKLLHPQYVQDDAMRRRFAQEARAGAQIESDYVVNVVAAGIDDATGSPWMAMELLDGRDLEDYAAEVGPMPPADALQILRMLCHAIAAAHDVGLVHRDLKPENIYLARSRTTGAGFTVKVLDFGIARPTATLGASGTAAMGTPLWMAPEQTTRGSKIGPPTDVWAIGLITFYLLTGTWYWRSPHDESASMTEFLRELALEPLDPASVRATEIGVGPLPAGFDEWFARCVVRETTSRFENARAAFAALEPILSEKPGTGPLARSQTMAVGAPVEPVPQPKAPRAFFVGTETAKAMAAGLPAPGMNAPLPAVVTAPAMSATQGGPPATRASRAWLWTALVAVLGLAGAGGAWLWRGRLSASAMPSAPPASAPPLARPPLRIGMSAPFTGPNLAIGTEMRRGVLAYVTSLNEGGGVHGRKVDLDSRDDGYEPSAARQNVKQLLDIREEVADKDSPDHRGPNSVFAILGNVGTASMLETVPLAMKNSVVFFAPFTGAQKYLRDGTNSKYVFNYRASYFEEDTAIVEYLFKLRAPRIPDHKHVLAFTQSDAYGDAGYAGLENAYNTLVRPLPGPGSIKRLRYERNAAATVEPAVRAAQAWLTELLRASVGTRESIAVVMVDTYEAGAEFIRSFKTFINEAPDRAKRVDVDFLHLSFVGPEALAGALTVAPRGYKDVLDPTGKSQKSFADGVYVTSVVPAQTSDAPGVKEYRNHIKAFDQGTYNLASLEEYLAAKLFFMGLERVEGDLTTDKLVDAFEKMRDVDLGIGVGVGFSPEDHQASHKVWGMRLGTDDRLGLAWTWTAKDGIKADH